MVDVLTSIPENCLDFKAFCEYLQKASGITITPEKSYLVAARIRNIMIDYQFSELSELIKELNNNNKKLHQKIINAMTTNETFWFRDIYPFQYIEEVLLPYWNSPNYSGSTIRIWSAACSSGQEPYSLGILFEEYKEIHPFSKRLEVVATDLSSEVLDKAKKGAYDKLCIGRGLSDTRLRKFFSPSCETVWSVNQNVKNYINFSQINLLEPYSHLGKFDIIFCRNVLIYFTRETKTDILTRMHACLKPGGLLCLGSSENLADASVLFSMIDCKPGIFYQAK